MSFDNTSDEYCAEKLRRENCDQFNTLVRMHLSFVLDLNTDDTDCVTEKTKFKKWSFVPFVKKSKCPNRGVMDGAPLTQEGICQVYQLIEYLGKEQNICAEGIFRRTGSLSRQQELRALLNQGQPLNLDGGQYSVHDCASVLKGFLAELPEPLLTDAHYPAHCQIAELCCNGNTSAETRLLRSLQLLLLLLPTENRVLLRDVLQLLNETASHEPSNKMSADSLATLFTPHLLCPRRLSPEALHTDSQTLSGIVAFMIRKGVTLFEIPPKLAVDIRAYFNQNPNEKSPGPAANTVYSFVDRERTARAHASDPTETALAQLYAYIQSLPESSKKRKLVKQFNRQNGNGTPLQVQHGSAIRSKSLGDSIKRHIFFNKTMKQQQRNDQTQRLRSSSEEMLNSPNCVPLTATRTKLFCVDCESSDEDIPEERLIGSPEEGHDDNVNYAVTDKSLSADDECSFKSKYSALRRTTRCFSEPDLSSENERCWTATCLTSTPAILPLSISRQFSTNNTFTPLTHHERKSMSPITRSTQKMSRAMQETMMTPRSRKPVLLMSGTNVCGLPKLDLLKQSDSSSSLLETAEDSTISNSRSLLSTESPIDASFSSRTDDYGYSGTSIDSPLFCAEQNQSFSNKRSESSNSAEQLSKRVKKEPVLKPKQYNSDGEPIVFETSF